MENKPITMYGWTCPRCMKVHSPYSAQCDCPPPTFTTSASTFTFTPCIHSRWIKTTKDYKRVKKCADCGEIKYPELFEGTKPLGQFEQSVLNETYKQSLKKKRS